MDDFIIFMHNDALEADPQAEALAWERYIATLKQSGRFGGGSAIGDGACLTRTNQAKPITSHLTGFIRVQAESLDDARTLLAGNPVFESGGTVEIRLLPRS
jgi:hypothetical protein